MASRQNVTLTKLQGATFWGLPAVKKFFFQQDNSDYIFFFSYIFFLHSTAQNVILFSHSKLERLPFRPILKFVGEVKISYILFKWSTLAISCSTRKCKTRSGVTNTVAYFKWDIGLVLWEWQTLKLIIPREWMMN